MMPFKTFFFASIAFLCIYGILSKKFEKKILENIIGKPKLVWGWLLISIGVVFSCIQIVALPFIFEKQDPLGTIFLWFCGFGIFSLLALGLVRGLFKCFKEIKGKS
jgi:Trk-type K+ transport system membrane component